MAQKQQAILGEKMQPRKRRMQIRQRQLRRRKNVSFRQLSFEEELTKRNSERWAKNVDWSSIEERTLKDAEIEHGFSVEHLIGNLQQRFKNEKLEILVEAIGKSSVKQELVQKFGTKLNVTTTDIRQGNGWPDYNVNVLDLTKKFGNGKFHWVVSTYGGTKFGGLPQKALFQIVTVLKPGGIGTISLSTSKPIPESELFRIAKRLNFTIIKIDKTKAQMTFVKNFGKRKKK